MCVSDILNLIILNPISYYIKAYCCILVLTVGSHISYSDLRTVIPIQWWCNLFIYLLGL